MLRVCLTQVYLFVEINQMVHIRYVHFTVCKFYLKGEEQTNPELDLITYMLNCLEVECSSA